MDRTERIAEGSCCSPMVKAIPVDIIVEDQLVIESIHPQHVGPLFPHPSLPAIFPIEVFGISHAGTAGKACRLPGECIQVHMVGHLGIRQDLGLRPVALDGHDVDEHPVIRFVAEQHLIV